MVGDAKSIFEGGLTAFHGQWVPTLEARFKGQSTKATDRLLEHHTRAFVLDKLLYALGWSQQANGGGHQNLLTEAFYDSAKPQEATLYLDYLGRDVANDLPLLVFESKRFKAVTPAQLIEVGAARRPKRRFASAAAALVDAFKDASWVKGEWAEHVKQLREYFNAVKKAHGYPPPVMAIGNGDWLVILRDPSRAFAGTASATDFLVIAPDAQDKIGDAYVRQFKEIYDLLAFERLSRVAKGVLPELIPTGIRTATEVMIMRGVRVGYSKFPKLNAALHPRFEIEPVAFVRTPTSPWVLVELNADTHELPHVHAQLPDHLNAVHNHSEQLLARIAQRLAVAPIFRRLGNHGDILRNEAPVALDESRELDVADGELVEIGVVLAEHPFNLEELPSKRIQRRDEGAQVFPEIQAIRDRVYLEPRAAGTDEVPKFQVAECIRLEYFSAAADRPVGFHHSAVDAEGADVQGTGHTGDDGVIQRRAVGDHRSREVSALGEPDELDQPGMQEGLTTREIDLPRGDISRQRFRGEKIDDLTDLRGREAGRAALGKACVAKPAAKVAAAGEVDVDCGGKRCGSVHAATTVAA